MNNSETGTLNRLKGIGVSNLNGVIDWKKVKDAANEFAFIKASEGADWVDATFAGNRKAARAAGLAVGYYHSFRPDVPVDAQVENFLNAVGKMEVDALRPVLDLENPALWQPIKTINRVEMILDWCRKVNDAVGVPPLLFGSPGFFTEVLENAPELATYELWVKNHGVSEPSCPKPWTLWTFWQSSDRGRVPGIASHVQINWFNGGDLKKVRARNQEPDDFKPGLFFKIVCWTAVLLYVAGLVSVIAEYFYR